MRPRWGLAKPANWLTLGLIGVCVVVYAAMHLFDRDTVVRALLISAYLQPRLPEIYHGQIWRLFTPILLHFSVLHIVFNLLWMWQLGQILESRQGSACLLVLVLVAAGVSNVAQYFAAGPEFGGLSGVVYALFGCVWIQGLYNRRFGVRLNPPVVYLLLGWFVFCWTGLLERFFDVAVANVAHTGGLVVGMLMGLLLSALSVTSDQ